jgi:hypothetical protein
MTWSPQSTSPTITGTIAFQKLGSPGTGGAGGTGGTGGKWARAATRPAAARVLEAQRVPAV